MITLKRAAFSNVNRTAEFSGRSIDSKPTNVANGSEYKEIDTGRVYVFDAENIKWIEKKVTA